MTRRKIAQPADLPQVEKPKMGLAWWVFFGFFMLFTIIATPLQVRLLWQNWRLGEQSRLWPTVEAKPTWSSHTSTSHSSSGRTSSSSTYLTCRYRYTVDGEQFEGRHIELNQRDMLLPGNGREILPWAPFEKEHRRQLQLNKKKWSSEAMMDDYHNQLALAAGKEYENEDGTVTVYYNFVDPSKALLVPGPSKWARGNAFGVLGMIALFAAMLAINPILVYRKRKKLARGYVETSHGS